MKTCDHCGNAYEKCFEVTMAGATHTFDSFECAIHALAPRCSRCGCTVLGHGIEARNGIFCCAHCARQDGEPGAVDNIGQSPAANDLPA
ncbi:hypothetical protein KBB96_10235 [Luteolibacter ambystomatis]|uniref:Metallothionein n=1 Tax=Luteolibacter ambystomatis TaxID=2824561 RepID=A0A975G5P1_9BACT|nr:hypothetical protein [Luteolibacter ambystomatis]QUE49251.1 hypothetical protein KBB96_10235 [Luteolibacter ambystomatis]